jgi:hypothetical protein
LACRRTTLLNNLGRPQHATGRFDEALESYRRALGRVDRTASTGGQRATLQANLAELLAARGELDESFELFTDVIQGPAAEDCGRRFLCLGRQRMDMLRDPMVRVSQYVSLVTRHFCDSPVHVRRAADLVLDRKALGADLLARQREAVLSAQYPELRERLGRLAGLRAWVAQRSLAGPDASAPEAAAEELRQAALDRERLESELAHEIPEFAARRLDRAADCAAVAAAVPTDAVVVEFLRYDAFGFTAVRGRGEDPWRPPGYLAIVIGPGERANPALFDLGEPAKVDALVAVLRSHIMGSREEVAGATRDFAHLTPELASADDAAALLRAAIVDPLTEAIGTGHRLLLAPDGDLLLLPFEMLPGRSGQHLIDDYVISYLTAARDRAMAS